LTENASEYGFYQSYTQRKERGNSGHFEEKWHWSYKPIEKKMVSNFDQ
jgi:hypothetical protein